MDKTVGGVLGWSIRLKNPTSPLQMEKLRPKTSSGSFNQLQNQEQNQEQGQTWSMVVSPVPDKFWSQRSVPGGLQLSLKLPDNLTSQILTPT